jgi:hypothetical protein
LPETFLLYLCNWRASVLRSVECVKMCCEDAYLLEKLVKDNDVKIVVVT